MTYAAFRSIGAYIPPKVMTNKDFEKIIDTTDEWITKEQESKRDESPKRMKHHLI